MPNDDRSFAPRGPKAREQLSLDAQKARREQVFYAGQIVRLRCGGPLMMVEGPTAIGPGSEPQSTTMGLMCCWMHGGEPSPTGSTRERVGGQLCRERFAVELLINCDVQHGANSDGTPIETEVPDPYVRPLGSRGGLRDHTGR